MPILTLDHRGRLMESDPNRSDGKGYKGQVPRTLSGDVYLGNAALRSQETQEEMNARAKAAQTFQDAAEVGMGRINLQRKKVARKKLYMSDRVRQTQPVQDQLARDGAKQSMMGCEYLDVNMMTGNGMTADGSPLRANPSMQITPVDPVELKQKIMDSVLFQQLCKEAQTGSQMVAYDQANSQAVPDQVDMQVQSLNVMKTAAQPKPVQAVHPMMAFFTK